VTLEGLLDVGRLDRSLARARERAKHAEVPQGEVPRWPATFCMPDDLDRLRSHRHEGPWLQRPRRAADSAATRLVTEVAGLEKRAPWVAQVALPWARRLRRRIVLTSVDPLTVWWYDGDAGPDRQAPAVEAEMRASVLRAVLAVRELLTEPGGAVDAELALDPAGRPWLLGFTEPAGGPMPRPADEAGFVTLFPAADAADHWAWLALPRPAEVERARAVGAAVPGASVLRVASSVEAFPLDGGSVVHDRRTGAITTLEPQAARAWEDIAAGRAADTSLAGRWREAGLLLAAGERQDVPERTATPERAPAPVFGWNHDRVLDCLGIRTLVRFPSWVAARQAAPALRGLRSNLGDAADLFVEVLADRGGWLVRGDGLPDLEVGRDQLAPAVRHVLLRAATRAQPAPLMSGTLVDRGADAVLLVGPPALRARAAARWTEAGGRLLADELATLGPDGVVTGGAAVGFEVETDHWLAVPAGAPSPPVDIRGRFVTYHLNPPNELSHPRTRSVAAVVVLEEGPAIARTEALAAIVRHAPPWLWSPRPDDAGTLVALVRAAACSRALDPSPETIAAA
jgi:hypothetical protein